MALVARRRQVVEMLTAESNRHGRAVDSVNRAIAAHVRWLRTQLAELDAALERAIRNSPLWSEKARLLRSVPAVGSVTVITLLSHLPELGTLSRRKIAALVGSPVQSRQRKDERQTRDLGWSRPSPSSTLHVHARRDSPKPAVRGVLRTIDCHGQETQGRTHSLHPQVAHHAECCAPTANTLEP